MAQYAHPEAVVGTDWLADHLGDPTLRIVDARFSLMGPLPAEYSEGHIPGAVFCDLHQDTSDLQGDVPCRIAPQRRFEERMGRLGIAADTHVVVYDQEFGPWAARLWWALRYYGHDRVSILDGGLRAWMLEGRPLESGPVTVVPTTFRAVERPQLRATVEEVIAAHGRSDVVVVDALPGKMFRGEALMFPTHRAGHIPGARNLSAPSNIDRTSGHLLGAAQLREVWTRVGLEPDLRVITYCGAGDYAAFDVFALHLIGHDNAAVYDGSWLEWGARADLPVETGVGTPGMSAAT